MESWPSRWVRRVYYLRITRVCSLISNTTSTCFICAAFFLPTLSLDWGVLEEPKNKEDEFKRVGGHSRIQGIHLMIILNRKLQAHNVNDTQAWTQLEEWKLKTKKRVVVCCLWCNLVQRTSTLGLHSAPKQHVLEPPLCNNMQHSVLAWVPWICTASCALPAKFPIGPLIWTPKLKAWSWGPWEKAPSISFPKTKAFWFSTRTRLIPG